MAFDPSKVDLSSLSQVSATENLDSTADDNLNFTMSEAVKVNPDNHAKVLDLSKKSGVPSFAVEDNPDAVEQDIKKSQFDFTGLRETNPKTAKHFDNIDNAIVAQDDVDVMKSIENVLNPISRFFGGAGEAVKATPELIEQSGKAFKVGALVAAQNQMTGIQDDFAAKSDARLIEKMRQLGVKTPRPSLVTTSTLQEYDFTKTDEFQTALTEYRTTAEEARKNRPEDFAGGFGFDAVQMVEKMVPILVTSAVTGGSTAGLTVMFGQVYSERQADLISQGMSLEDARVHAFASATIETVTEKIPLDILVKKLGWSGVKKFIGFTVAESLQEGASSALQSAWDKATINPDLTLDQALNELGYEMLLGGTGGAAISATYIGAEKAVNALTKNTEEVEAQGDVEQRQIDEINTKSTESKLRERDKESFKQFVEQADGEANTTVFVDSAQAALYMQDKTSDEIEADAALKMLSDQLAEASVTGTDVQIPVADFAAEFAGTDHFTELRDSMTMSAETVAPFRQEQVKKETDAYVTKLMDEAQQNTSEYVQAQEIFTTVRDQLVDTGAITPENASVMAKIVPAWATATAVRQGKTVEQVYKDSGLVIEGPQTGERARQAGEMVLEQQPVEVVATALESVSDDIYSDLASALVGPFDGGCVMCANALQKNIGGNVSVLVDENDIAQHAVVERDGMLFDQDGPLPIDKFIKRFNSQETDNITDVRRIKENDLPEAVRDDDIEKSMTQRLSEVLNQQPEQFAQSVEESTDTPEFKKWSGDGEVVEPEDVNDYVFKADTPVVLKVFHGTTHKFDVFDAKRGNLEGQFGAINYFTSSEYDASDNYAGEGPDLTSRIERRSEELAQNLEDQFDEQGRQEVIDSLYRSTNELRIVSAQVADMDNHDAADEIAKVLARRELSGGEEEVMELFVRVDNPFVIGENAGWIEFVDNEAIQTEAEQQVADNNDITVKELDERRDEFEDEIDEARWDIQNDTPHKLVDAIQTVSDRHDVDAAELAGSVYDFGEEATPEAIEELLRNSEDYAYAEDAETGELINSQLIAEVIEEMGFDSIILRNAETRFETMNINAGTAHVHIFDSNKTNIKSTENIGTFDPTDPNIFKQKDKKQVARGYYDPANSVIRLTEAANLSTFLHEFAHFMYEMEVDGNTDMLQSINNWYKRNAVEVAAEANTYLGTEFDTLKQGVDESVDVRKQRAKEQGFDVDTVHYHGGGEELLSADFAFDPSFKATSTGFWFADNESVAEEYGDTVISVYLKKGKMLDISEEGISRYFKDESAPDIVNKMSEKGYDLSVDEFHKKVTDPNFWQADDSTSFQNALIESLTELGYDSLRIDDAAGFSVDPSTVIFNPENIIRIDDNIIFAQEQDTPTGKEGSITADDVVAFLDQTTTGDTAKDAAIRRAVHEQFARGFEQYLMEGKAPSIELRNAFRTFARWLVQIYKSLRGQLNVNIDDEMRAVFDRLVATEEQIAAAEARAHVEPLFTDAAMAGMTEAEFAKYKERQQKVKDVQTETLRNKIIKHLTRQTKAWWNEEKNDIIDEETDTLKKERVHAAREMLKSKELKIDHATVRETYGEEKTDKIGRKSVVIPTALKGMTAKGQQGVHPDEAAAFLGYGSGAEMINDIMTAPSLKAAATANAEARMVETHGDVFTDGTIERAADEAVVSEERGKLILDELKALAKGTNVPTIDRVSIKELAVNNISRLSFREIHPGKYRKAEIRAAQEAATMLAAGNKEGASAAKLRQVMNYYLGMEANNAKNETMKIVDRMGRYNKKKVREEIIKAENGYWEQIVNILSRFEFRKSASLTGVDSINLWMKERMEADGDGLVLSNAVLNESYVTHWKNIPFADLQGVNDSVKNIEHVARYGNKIRLQQDEIDFKKLKSEWVDHINEQDARFPTKNSRSRTDDARKSTTMEHVRRWASQLTKVPFLASWLDGGARTGLSQDILVQQFTDALDVKMRLVDEVATPVLEAINNRSKEDQKRHNTKIWIPEIEDHLMGHQVLAVALNTGNQGNLKKMLLGEGWADSYLNEEDISFENPKLQAVLKHMNKNDWDLVQKIWDQMEILYPQLAEVHRKTTGLVPPKVVSTPIATEFGEYKGGYYPIKYSPKRSHKAEKNAEKREAETESMFNNTASIQSSVNAGATNERTGFYDRIHLSLEVVPDHFNETIHYITHHDAVRQLNRLLQAPDVADAITGVLGEAEFKQLKPWLNDVAKDGRQQPVKTYIDEAFGRLRFGTTLGVMGFKASTGIMQLFGLFTTAADLGVGSTVKGIQTTIGRSWYMKAIRNHLGSVDAMQTGWDFANERSKVMNHRTKTMDREIRNAMNRLAGKTGFLAAVQETSMKHIMLIQTYMVDLPTWHAAYSKELSESGDEAAAIKRADWSVENLQGSGATKDMATILRNQSKIHTTFTMFMTFFSSLGNLTVDIAKGKKSGLYSNTAVAAKLMFLFTLPVFFEMLMRGELDEPDDDDDRLNKFLMQSALYPLTSIPFVRDVAGGVIGDYGYRSSPVASILEKGIGGLKQMGERAFTDDEVTKGAQKNVSKLVGASLGVPGINQAWATGEHLYDVIENGEELTMQELIFGPKRE